MALVRRFRPDAIVLNLHLSSDAGWVLLDQLKHDPATRHIPVDAIAVAEAADRVRAAGAVGTIADPVREADLDRGLRDLNKWVERKERYVLVVEPDPASRQEFVELLGGGEVRVTGVATGAEMMPARSGWNYDCVVLNLSLADRSAIDLVEEIQHVPALCNLPVFIYAGREPGPEDQRRMARLTSSGLVLVATSAAELLGYTTLYLHIAQERLPAAKRGMLAHFEQANQCLAGGKVLVVDDDVRNIFALTSLLERHRIQVFTAESSREALQQLEQHPDISLVLMDIMMPDMDGYEAIRAIRAVPGVRAVPVIAITAKAMKGDREKCLDSGASDYTAKPIDAERLLALLRVWLHRL